MTAKGFRRKGRRLVAECASLNINTIDFSASESVDCNKNPMFSYSLFRYKDHEIIGHVMFSISFHNPDFSDLRKALESIKKGDTSIFN